MDTVENELRWLRLKRDVVFWLRDLYEGHRCGAKGYNLAQRFATRAKRCGKPWDLLFSELKHSPGIYVCMSKTGSVHYLLMEVYRMHSIMGMQEGFAEKFPGADASIDDIAMGKAVGPSLTDKVKLKLETDLNAWYGAELARVTKLNAVTRS